MPIEASQEAASGVSPSRGGASFLSALRRTSLNGLSGLNKLTSLKSPFSDSSPKTEMLSAAEQKRIDVLSSISKRLMLLETALEIQRDACRYDAARTVTEELGESERSVGGPLFHPSLAVTPPSQNQRTSIGSSLPLSSSSPSSPSEIAPQQQQQQQQQKNNDEPSTFTSPSLTVQITPQMSLILPTSSKSPTYAMSPDSGRNSALGLRINSRTSINSVDVDLSLQLYQAELDAADEWQQPLIRFRMSALMHQALKRNENAGTASTSTTPSITRSPSGSSISSPPPQQQQQHRLQRISTRTSPTSNSLSAAGGGGSPPNTLMLSSSPPTSSTSSNVSTTNKIKHKPKLSPHNDIDNESSSDGYAEDTTTAYQVVDFRPPSDMEDMRPQSVDLVEAEDDVHQSFHSHKTENPYQSNKEKDQYMVSSRQSSGSGITGSASARREQHHRASFSGNTARMDVETSNRSRTSITCSLS